jgi:hypothetical protein
MDILQKEDVACRNLVSGGKESKPPVSALVGKAENSAATRTHDHAIQLVILHNQYAERPRLQHLNLPRGRGVCGRGVRG